MKCLKWLEISARSDGVDGLKLDIYDASAGVIHRFEASGVSTSRLNSALKFVLLMKALPH